MGDLGTFIALIVGLLTVTTHLANMADRQKKEGAREERVNRLLDKMDDALSRLRGLEDKVTLLTQRIDLQDEELQGLRKDIRENNGERSY